MNHAQLRALSGSFRERHQRNRAERERAELLHGLGLLAMGLFGAAVAVAVLIYAFGG